MKQFIDTQGRTWGISIATSTIDRVKELAAIDLLEIASGDVFDQLHHPVTLANVAYAICKPSADAQQIDRDNFRDAISGDVIDQLSVAVIDAVVEYFPEQSRRLAETAVKMYRETKSALMEQAMANLTPELLAKAMEELRAELMRQPSGGQSTSWPESAESTPAP